MPTFNDYVYLPLVTRLNLKSRKQEKIYLGVTFAAGIVFGLVVLKIWQHRSFGVPATALDSYQHINVLPVIHQPSISGNVNTDERAVVTSMYTDSTTYAIATLGYSLKKANVTAKRVVIYLPERISQRALCIVRAAGWETVPVELVPPPHGGKGIYEAFVDQYTKLSIWKMDRIGIKTVVYLDADTLVRRNFDELWSLPFELGAVPDTYVGDGGFTIGFNAGVLLLQTSTDVYNDMLSKTETATYSLRDAEQAFLNLYFGAEVLRLPYVYGGNLAIKERSQEMWDGMLSEIRVVHYTLVKPFDIRPWCGYFSSCAPDLVFDAQRRTEFIQTAKKKSGGKFAVEVGWWEDDYNGMMVELGDQCN